MDEKKLFDECMRKAITLARKYMNCGGVQPEKEAFRLIDEGKVGVITEQEFNLAMFLFKRELDKLEQ